MIWVMDEPNIVDTQSHKITLKPGTYAFCACGFSKTGVFCDGTHRQKSTLTPIRFTLEEEKQVSLCMCKHSHSLPFCDGTHRSLTES